MNKLLERFNSLVKDYGFGMESFANIVNNLRDEGLLSIRVDSLTDNTVNIYVDLGKIEGIEEYISIQFDNISTDEYEGTPISSKEELFELIISYNNEGIQIKEILSKKLN